MVISSCDIILVKKSAIARPLQHFAYAPGISISISASEYVSLETSQQQSAYAASPILIELGAVLTAGIVRNHPFIDGNTRTGFVAGVVFLEMSGFDFHSTMEQATQHVLALSAGEIDEAAYAQFLREFTTPSKPAQTPPPGA